MIDAKHWTGEVRLAHGRFSQNGRSRATLLRNAADAAAAVSSALGRGSAPITPVICLTNSGSTLPPTHVEGVLVVGLDHLLPALGPVPTLDLELAQTMQRVPALLTAHQGAEPESPHLPPNLGADRRLKGAARTQVSHHGGAPRPARREQSTPVLRRHTKKRARPAFVLLLYFVFFYLLATNLDILMAAQAPIVDGFVSMLTD